MFPRSSPGGRPHFTTEPGIGHGIFSQDPVPLIYSQQHWSESQLNVTNSNLPGIHLNACSPLIHAYQWKPRHSTPPPYSSSPLTKNRKRRSDDHSQHEGKKQRFIPVDPHGQPAKPACFPPTDCSGGGGAGRSPIQINYPRHPPLTPKRAGCVPSLSRGPQEIVFNDLPLVSAKDKLSQQIVDLFSGCQQQSEDLEKKEICRAQLQKEIQRLFPYSRVYLAGSSLNGFGSRSSDADLCLVIQEGSVSSRVNQKTDALYILSLVQQLFSRLSYIDRPQLIRAKVPILKFRDKVSGVEFDLNVNNIVGIRNTFLLRSYAYIEKRVRPLILVMKKWARHHRINDASQGTLSSYTLVLMVLHYLQTLPEPVIPCLQREYPECFNSSMDIHLVPEGPKDIPPYSSKNMSSLGDLFLGFLKYYATVFKWDKLVISVREAKAFPKPNSQEWRNKFISVEEPFDGSNTARAVHEKLKFDVIKTQFNESWQVLQQRKDLNSILPMRMTMQKPITGPERSNSGHFSCK